MTNKIDHDLYKEFARLLHDICCEFIKKHDNKSNHLELWELVQHTLEDEIIRLITATQNPILSIIRLVGIEERLVNKFWLQIDLITRETARDRH